MNPIKLTELTYKEGSVIHVNETVMKGILQRGEEVLGFPSREYDFSFVFVPKEVQEISGVSAAVDVEESKFLTTEQQHEAVLFHEGVHYIMYKNGLLFGPERTKAGFYDRLVDETVADVATTQVYGYNYQSRIRDVIKSYERLNNLYEENKDINFNEVIKIKLMEVEESSLLRLFDGSGAIIPLEICKKQRDIEEKYRESPNFDLIYDDVNKFYQYLYSLEPKNAEYWIKHGVAFLSKDNALALTKSGISAKELVSRIAEMLQNRWDSYGIYFYVVVDLLD